jgi:N-acetylmuramoyl-L-alanine amidase
MKRQRVTGVILHHTGVLKNRSISLQSKMQNLQAFSQKPGLLESGHSKPAWPDVPYHFYVDASGQIAEGRDVDFAGDTNTNYDTYGYIQIAVEGDFEKEQPDASQLDAVRELLVWILLSRDLPTGSIAVHKDRAPTTCPGKNFLAMLPNLLSEVSKIRSKVAAGAVFDNEPRQ